MTLRSRSRRSLRYTLLAAGCLIVVAAAVFGPPLLRFDCGRLFSREAWQITDRVIESLKLEREDYVADIGAGDGYFTFRLAEAVGPGGRVFAVDIDEGAVQTLRQKASERRSPNVEVILGRPEDPLLPDDSIDLAFLCNSYHHINNRTAYLSRLKTDLKPGGRVVIIDLREIALVKLLAPEGHWSTEDVIRQEMDGAGFHENESFDFLPIQSFLIFSKP